MHIHRPRTVAYADHETRTTVLTTTTRSPRALNRTFLTAIPRCGQVAGPATTV